MCKNRFPIALGAILFTGLFSLDVMADIVIIGNKAMPDDIIDAKTAKKLWLGKTRKLSGVGKVVILDQAKNSSIKDEFYKHVTNKTSAQAKAYWAKIVFTGKALPPKSLSSDQEVIDYVKSNDNVIGYIDSASVNDSIKVLYTIK